MRPAPMSQLEMYLRHLSAHLALSHKVSSRAKWDDTRSHDGINGEHGKHKETGVRCTNATHTRLCHNQVCKVCHWMRLEQDNVHQTQPEQSQQPQSPNGGSNDTVICVGGLIVLPIATFQPRQ